MRSRDRGAVALAAAGVLARVLLAILGWTESASERLELASPVDALARIREGHALWGMGQSPYGGSALHAPPLYLALVGPLVANAPAGLVASVPFIVADLVAAAAIHRVATASTRTADAADASPTSPAWTVALFLANPFSIASCAAASSAGFRAAALAVSLAGAVEGTPVVAGAGVAALAYLGDPTCAALTVPSLARAMAREGGFGTGTGKKGKGKGRGRAGAEDAKNAAVVHLCAWIVGWIVALVGVSQAVMSNAKVASMDWIRATYGFRLVAEDLSPNLGCFWYFFTEMFDNFRVFSLRVRLLPGRAVRAGRRQARRGRTSVLRVHRQAAVRRVLALSNPRRRRGIPRVAPALSRVAGGRGRIGYLVCAGYVASALLSPIMWRLWIVDRVANANFFFATTLAWMATQSALCVLCVDRVVANTRLAKKKS